MSLLFLDFETRSTVDLKKQGLDVYARHPSTEVLCVAGALDEGPVELWDGNTDAFPSYLIHEVQTGTQVVAHNAAFELAIWNHTCVPKYGWPHLKPEQIQCTMAMAYAQSLPGALADAAPALGLPLQKDSVGHRVMRQLSSPKTILSDGTALWWAKNEVPEKFEQLYAYCKQDVEVERALYHRLLKLSPFERELWILDQRINQRGIQVDIPSAHTALEIVEFEKSRLDREMREITGNAVATCTATSQLTDWLISRGVACDGVSKSDILALLDDLSIPPDCRRALLHRQEAAKSSTAKLKAMLDRTCWDGRIRSTMQFHGAGTGRWAGRGLQVQNFPRSHHSQDDIENVFEILGGS